MGFAVQISILAVFFGTVCVNACELPNCNEIETAGLILNSSAAPQRTLTEEADLLPHWNIKTEQKPLLDSLNVTVTTTSPDLVKCRWGTSQPKLVFACEKGQPLVYFATHCRISTSIYDDYGEVTYRIDDRSVQTKLFSESEDNRSMGLWDPTDVVPFIKSLLGSQQIVAMIKPYSDKPFTATFQSAGLSDAIAPLISACDWPDQ